jgi:hypothetical protein
VEVCIVPRFLTSALDGGERSDSHAGRFAPGEITPQYPLDGRLGGSQGGLDAVKTRKILQCR